MRWLLVPKVNGWDASVPTQSQTVLVFVQPSEVSR
jgi:hypothetical protein